jgi:enamine deaminase RidA (YjgF/YER057c/UK114 family)
MLGGMSKRRTIIPKGFEFYYEQFHFAPAVRVGKTIYCSGQLGWAGAGQKPPTDVKEQFALAFENLRRVLEAAGADFDDVIEMTTFHVDLQKHLNTFVAVKADFMKAPHPAWTAIGITELAIPGALVEIRATARV